jgi:arabinofuranosyltransferase
MRVKQNMLIFLPLLIFLAGALDRMWITEDAFITFRVVENIFLGHGPVFNPGIRVEAYTHPLWLFILCILRLMGADFFHMAAAATGIVFSVSGMLFVYWTLYRSWSCRQPKNRMSKKKLWPAGALVVSSIPVFWDFASSGLEGGLSFLWLGGAFYFLMESRTGNKTKRTAFWLSLGIMIRPDFAVFFFFFSLCFGFFMIYHKMKVFELSQLIVLLVLIPLIYQIFRMGYFASLVPNTALAKEGFQTNWSQGFLYFRDLLGTYHLWVPFFLIGGSVLTRFLHKPGPTKYSREGILKAVFLLAGTVHILSIVRLGGDFMHGRMLLPGIFAVLVPFFMISRSISSKKSAIWQGGMVFWAFLSILFFVPDYAYNIGPHGIADERLWYVHRSNCQRPVTLEDYGSHSYFRIGEKMNQHIKKRGAKAVYWSHIGIAPAVLPESVIVIDPLGLNDHISGRMELDKKGRPGHDKIAPPVWFQVRYPSDQGIIIRPQLNGKLDKPPTVKELLAARAFMNLPVMQRLQRAVAGPLTSRQFFCNMRDAFYFSRLRIPPDPEKAFKRFAGD